MGDLFGKVIGAYFVISLLISSYFDFQYISDFGFMKFMLGGIIYCTLKALVWPYYLFM